MKNSKKEGVPVEKKEIIAAGAVAKSTAVFGAESPVLPNMDFSNTVFTDNNKAEVRRYKNYLEKLNKKNEDVKVKPDRYKPTAANGLTEEQVRSRVNTGFVNYTKKGSTKTVWNILFTNIFTWFNILCFICVGLLIWVEKYTSTYFIIIVFLNMLIGIIQEIKAKVTIEKLSLMTASTVKVVRCGEKCEIVVDDVVLDDILVLANGQQIPADSIVIDGMIEVNESLLTGESAPIQKKPGEKVMAGSFVVSGTCLVRVDKIGKNNYVQTLASGATRYVRPKSELLSGLKLIIRTVSVIMFILAGALIVRFLAGADFGTFQDAVASIIGSIIGMIPSGMFLLTSLALSVGVINLAKSHTQVQELYCIEMLARVDTLCLDKTGTITSGAMKVCEVVEVKNTTDYTIRELIASMLFALQDNNLTAVALQEHFGNQCIIKATNIMPFSSSRKLSAVTFAEEGTFILGAPEYILRETNERVDERVRRFASQGYRVLVLAKAGGTIKDGRLPDGSVKPLALITLQDQIRDTAPKTIEWFKNNGVDVRVISGDNPITVSEVAKRAGITNADKYISLEGLSPVEVRNAAREYTVFGRVSPEQKLLLVQELKQAGRTVAMTGDGVNDILALREADCSIAMAAGAEAARNVSHLVLMDSNFASMPKVVMQGRRVVNNIQNTSSIYLFKTLFVMLITIFSISIGQKYPFEPINMVILEFFVIGFPSFALALEINDSKIKGNFLLNVLRNSFAGAIIVLLNIIVLFILNTTTGIISDESYTTLCVMTVTITGLMMLWKVVQPLNAYRLILVMLMTVLVCVVAYFAHAIVLYPEDNLMNLQLHETLILIVILQASYPLIAFINNMLAKIHLDRLPIFNKFNERSDK